MANRFPIGVSAAPIDITSGARAFSRSALESRLQEIASSKEQITENEKRILKAMSIQAPAELFKKQRERYLEDEQGLREKAINIFKESGGKPTTQQLTEIEDSFGELENQYKGEVVSIKTLGEYRDKLDDPRTRDLLDVKKAGQVLADAHKSIEETGYLPDDFNSKWLGTFREDSPATYLDKFYESELKTLPVFESADYDGNIFKTIEKRGFGTGNAEAEEKVIRARDMILQTDPKYVRQYTMPDGSINEEAYARAKTEVEDWMNAYNERAQKGYKTDTGGGAAYSKSAVELTPTSGGVFNLPADVTQGIRNIDLVQLGAVDADTGEKINDRFMESRLVNMDLGDNTIALKIKGGAVSRGGEPLYGKMTGSGIGSMVKDDLASKKANGATASDIKGQAEDIIKANSKHRDGIVENVKVTETKDGIVVTGTVYDKSWGRKKGEGEPVTAEYNILRDESVERFAKVPLPKFRNLLAKYGKKYYITAQDGKRYSWGEILDNPSLYGKVVEKEEKGLPPSLKIK